jgi:DNA-binding MarR family transcriptional regulator
MAEVVSRLADRGLIRTERDRRDGRRKTIALTTKGLHAVQHLIPRTHAMTDRLVGSLAARERQELLRLLTELVRANERR